MKSFFVFVNSVGVIYVILLSIIYFDIFYDFFGIGLFVFFFAINSFDIFFVWFGIGHFVLYYFSIFSFAFFFGFGFFLSESFSFIPSISEVSTSPKFSSLQIVLIGLFNHRFSDSFYCSFRNFYIFQAFSLFCSEFC